MNVTDQIELQMMMYDVNDKPLTACSESISTLHIAVGSQPQLRQAVLQYFTSTHTAKEFELQQ